MEKWFQEYKIELLNQFQKTSRYCARIMHVLILLVGLGLAVVWLAVWIAPHTAKIYHQVFTVFNKGENLSDKDKRNLEDLLLKNKIIPISEVYDRTLEYYNSLISVLVALLASFAFLSWFSLKTKIKEEVQQEIEKFFSSAQTIAWFNELLEKKISEKREWLFLDQKRIIGEIEDQILERLEDRRAEEVSEEE